MNRFHTIMLALVCLTLLQSTPALGQGGPNCPVSCQVPNEPPFIPEGEPCGANTINCGCDCPPQENMLQLRCPEGYCGNTWAIGGQQDTDWYNVHVNDNNNDGTEQVCFIVKSEVPLVVELYSGNCGSLTLLARGEANDCDPLTLCACIPAPQFAKLKIYPGTKAGGPILNGIPCQPPAKYTLRYQCGAVCTMGACCFVTPAGPDCQIMTQQQCATMPSSVWHGVGSLCNPDPCGAIPTGACCYVDTQGIATCQIMSAMDCQNLMGQYLGNNVPCPPPGAPCGTTPDTGACCYTIPGVPGSLCIVTTAADCQAIYNGQYLGNNVPCPPVGTPCDAPTGACCYIDATGVWTCAPLTQSDCVNVYHGTYYGNGSNCANIVCDPPQTGACCYTIPGTPGVQCVITTQIDCLAVYNGTYLGNGSSCFSATGQPVCDVKGACCYRDAVSPSWTCVEVSPQVCATLPNSTYWGNGTTCATLPAPGCNPPPPTGACCYQIAGTIIFQCIITTQQDCLTNYFNPQWFGANTTCNPNPCPPLPVDGACCYIDPLTFPVKQCIITTQQDCETNYMGGIWLGANTTCTPDPCNPPPPRGACCWQDLPNPTVFCTITTQQLCLTQYPNGVWQGANTTCNPNPCPPTPDTGACCYEDPTGVGCVITTQQDCLTNYPLSQWLGPNTSCVPNPCIPTGACCYQIPGTTIWQCNIMTQAQCAAQFNGTYQGPNTTCNPNPCPKTGACCYMSATGPTCQQLTQQQCLQLQGTYLGDGIPCSTDSCKPCVNPPPNMVGWWPLDESSGGIAYDTVGAQNGAYKPTTATGPIPAPGNVAGSLQFDGIDDYVLVPHTNPLNFNCGPFTIDAWVRRQGPGGIVSKTGLNQMGYDFAIDANGLLTLTTTSASLRCIAQSTATVPLNVWSHVAVTVGPAPLRMTIFYINGTIVGSGFQGCDCLGNTGPFLIGSSPYHGLMRGRLDEIEVFNRELMPTEIVDIYLAGPHGKCKHRCSIPWNTPLCLNQNAATVTFTVCNDSPVPQAYNVAFQPLPVGGACTIAGPTVFTPGFSNPVNIPANTCINLTVTINRPAGMNAVNQVGCYQVNVTNINNGHTSKCQGSLIDRRDLCAVLRNCCIGVEVVHMGMAKVIKWNVFNPNPTPVDIPYEIAVLNADNGSATDYVRLNGLPPGIPVKGTMSIQPNDTGHVEVDADYVEHHGVGFDEVIFSSEDPALGPGVMTPLSSTGLMSRPRPLCRADLAPNGGDGIVSTPDLLFIINNWGACQAPCMADLAPLGGDGVVSTPDLLFIINNWGPCPTP